MSRMQTYIEARVPGMAGSWRILEAATPLRCANGGTEEPAVFTASVTP